MCANGYLFLHFWVVIYALVDRRQSNHSLFLKDCFTNPPVQIASIGAKKKESEEVQHKSTRYQGIVDQIITRATSNFFFWLLSFIVFFQNPSKQRKNNAPETRQKKMCQRAFNGFSPAHNFFLFPTTSWQTGIRVSAGKFFSEQKTNLKRKWKNPPQKTKFQFS